MKSLPTSAVIAAALMLFAALPAPAQRAPNGCRIGNPDPLRFGDYTDGQTAPLNTLMTIILSCKGNAIYVEAVITAGPGENSGDMLDRRMRHKKDPESYLRYQVYVDAARTRILGDGTRGTEVLIFPYTNRTGNVYAQMPGGQSGVEGDYGDVIQITVMP